jgi:hypothetical protein
MLSCRRRLLPVLSIRNKGLRDFPGAGNRETGETEQGIAAAEQGIFAAEQRIEAAHSRVSLHTNRGAPCHAIVAIFTTVRAAALAMMMGPGKGADAPGPEDTIA